MFELVVSTTMTVSPNSTMLPPIWVAACDSQRRRNAGCGRRRGRLPVASARSAGGRPRLDGTPARSRRPVGRGPCGPASSPATAAVIAGSPRSTNSARRRSSVGALEQDVAAAGPAAQADVGARAGRRATCRRRTGGVAGAGRRRRGAASRTGRSGTAGRVSEARTTVSRDERRGRRRQLDAVDRRHRRRSRRAASPASWAMMPPEPRQRAGQLVRRADRVERRTGRRAPARRR